MDTASAYLFGLVFIFRGVYGLKVYGDMRTMMSSGSNIKGPLILLLVGSALMFFPTTKSVFLETTFGVGQQTPLSYDSVTGMDVQTFRALLGFVQLVGVISFVRGWIILAHSASPSSQSQFPKAIIHIIAGLLAINIQGTINVVNATLY
jgi:intracellular multiplication protein IcmC